MDPKELAKLYAAQMAKEAADRAAEKAADVAATKARESAAADAENALNNVAIPYLKEIKSAMGGNFTFDVQREVTSNRTLGVKFEVKVQHHCSPPSPRAFVHWQGSGAPRKCGAVLFTCETRTAESCELLIASAHQSEQTCS